ncbi:hypothetical protein SAMN05216559_0266 [Halomicrobium zhouii]|uniref:Right handed beta helix region n=1 Tax=Halomicrobium zhouii TaxID=767519 RepID=A0A1I6K6F0_9EURY|nr:hypothetical protein [Halomicrobium zhouii]SFR86802.1 hypothetical protein SAMN05216559_0266 [Halomicrobium zhouii]
MTSLRRRTLLQLAGAASAAVAGCQGVDLDAGQGAAKTDQQAPNGEVTTREAIETGLLNGIPQVRAQADDGSGTREDPYQVPADLFADYHGTVEFGSGWFETDGVETDPDFDYSDTSTYLQGEGVRTTTLRHAADEPSTPTVRLAGKAGNFGGVRNMTVYGAGEGDRSGDANIVETDGNVIDYTFENVIFRWGGGDALHLAASASGCRVQNAWVENVNGHALYLGGGNRLKVDNVHAIGSGFLIEGAESHFTNVTIFSAGGNDGIVNTTPGNQYADVILKEGLNAGFRGTSRFSISNMHVEGAKQSAIVDGTGNSPISNVFARNWGRADGWRPLLRASGSSVRASGVWGERTSEEYSTTLLRVEDDDCYVNGIGGTAGEPWKITIEGGTESVLDNVANVDYEHVTDEGVRTLINRWGTNDGDPAVEGEWNGHADYAGATGATVWDTSTEPWTAYRAQPDGRNWVAL